MKKILLASIAATTICGAPALAADLPTKAPFSAPIVAVSMWSDCYVGGNIGYGWQHTGQTDAVGVNLTDTGTGAVGGLQVGCDRQFGTWVLGIQNMFDWSGISASQLWPTNPNETEGAKTKWLETLTGRIGYTLQPQTLIYLKGGAAWVHNTYSDVNPITPYSGQAAATRVGWTLGGGLEYKFNRNWSAFAEYNYINLGNNSTTLTYTAPFPLVVTYNYSQNVQTALFGINYSFGDWIK